jgi:hypothetical protein
MRTIFPSLAVLAVAVAMAAAGTTAGGGTQRGQAQADALRRLPSAVLWMWRVNVMMPENFRRFGRAIEVERARLKPGESATFHPRMSVGPDRKPVKFLDLVPAGRDLVIRENTTVLRDIEISVHGGTLGPFLRLSEFTQEEFEALRSSPSAGLAAMDLQDVNFALACHAARLGADPAKDGVQWVDLASNKARSVAAGTIILVARAGHDHYEVWNEATRSVERTRAAEQIQASGNAIYLLVRQGDRRWVAAHRGLHSIEAGLRPGSQVRASQVLGELGKDGPLEGDAALEVWRVLSDDQLFLRNLDRPGAEARRIYGWWW